jgi:branched-chain amino acid transport system ATP-binding protein
MDNSSPLLEVDKAEVFYGGIRALHGVSLHVNRGEIVSVIGANGAGKSTLLRAIASVKPPDTGTVTFMGKPVPRKPHRTVRTGITLVPEGRRIFAPLTVRQNLMAGAYTQTDKKETERTLESMYELFPRLKERLSQRGGTLSGGEQQMLAVARAMMSQPKLLMLDEPSLGLAPVVIDAMFEKIVRLNREMGLTILLVEQNASLALEIAHRAYVLETGSISLEGAGRDLLMDPRVQASYLGITH